MTSTCLLTPHDLGLPPKFTTFRPGQGDAITTIVEADQRFIAGAYPTGTGKSVVAVGSGLLNGGRTVILTSTKLLARQYMDDFADVGIVEMKGQSNFPCHESRRRNATCAEGKQEKCQARVNHECPYLQARNEFLGASISVTNYDYSLSSIIYGDGCGSIDLLILDEAHSAVQQLSDALTITFDHWDFFNLYQLVGTPPASAKGIEDWKEWGVSATRKLSEFLRTNPDSPSIPHLELFKSTLTRLQTIDSTWVSEHSERKSQFSPLWPTAYAKRILFASAKKVLLVSATIVPKTLTLLDIQPEESLFLHTAFTFPIHRAPVYLFGEFRIDHKTTPAQWQSTLGRMDSLIDRRLDRKGTIHSVSYDKQEFIHRSSSHRDIMLTPRASVLPEAINEFRKSPPPRILVSPAITTGYDFPGRQCEYQIIIKMPFIDTRGGIMAARVAQDPEYASYLTAQTLTQMCGRPMRSADDQVENVILDAHAAWFFKPPNRNGRGGYRHLFPSWFIPLVRYIDYPPTPPPPLQDEG